MSSPEIPSFTHEKREFPLEFYITDHSAKHAHTGTPEQLRRVYGDIRKDGIESVRNDWDWDKIEPAANQFSEEHLERYGSSKQIMEEVGLHSPTIILSNPPAWAKELYKSNKEGFFQAYRQYAERVRERLVQLGGEKISKIQVLNELNNGIYTPIEVEDVGRMCDITREVFAEYNPDLKLMATVLASNTTKFVGTPIEQFLPKLKVIKDKFDIIAVDYYPGLWHFDMKDAPSLKPNELFKHAVKQLGLLKTVFEEIATWDKAYELGEVGIPTKLLWGGERGQRYFYDAFFRAFKHLMADLRNRNLALPTRVGFYESVDEPPQDLKGKILRNTPFPEFDLGVRTAEGKEKAVTPRLKEIIQYLRSPL